MAPRREAESLTTGSINHDTETNNNAENDQSIMSFNEIVYGVESFYAIVGPGQY